MCGCLIVIDRGKMKEIVSESRNRGGWVGRGVEGGSFRHGLRVKKKRIEDYNSRGKKKKKRIVVKIENGGGGRGEEEWQRENER